MDPSHSLAFTSERFDYTSSLPEEYNAGNRFYGRDVAAFLAEALTACGCAADYLDEDWGWLVFSVKGTVPDFLLAVYNLSDHREGNKPGGNRWGLWIQQFETRKVLGILPKRTAVPVSPVVLRTIEDAVRSIGATSEPWDERA